MVLSMTGYGRGQVSRDGLSYQVEIKTLNSKSTDIRCKLPDGFMQEEIFIRQIVQEKVVRGRIEVVVTDTRSDVELDYLVNESLIRAYYHKLSHIASDLGASTDHLFSAILRLSDINDTSAQPIEEANWTIVKEALELAIEDLNVFRADEGAVLGKDLIQRAAKIQELLPKVEMYEAPRIEKLKERLKRNLEDFIQMDRIDHNRFEQEVLFYIEKLDITEEKLRLEQHCKYFRDQVQNESYESGKVLSFIAQEMGREINTLGSKAQDSDLQQIVVSMKDELEKIKEQIANIL